MTHAAARPVRALTLVVASALFMENLDSTVIATSLAAIASDLGVDPITLKLAFTAYYVALAIFIPISGWCADRFGARQVFRAAIAVFSLASIGCALAWNLESLVAARFCQGVGGAMMVPVGRLILLRSIPKRDLVPAMAWLTVPALFAPLIGPPLGGFITTYYHWRGIFWLNVPIGILGLFLASWLVPNIRETVVRPLDVRGFLLTGIGLSLILFGSTLAGRSLADAPLAWSMVAMGLLLIGLYVLHARRTPWPLLDLSLLKIPTFRTALLGGLLFRAGIGAVPFLLPLMLQIGFGMTPFQSGMLTFAAAIGALAMKLSAAPILRRFGFRRVLLVNGVISSALLGCTGLFTSATPGAVILTVLAVAGFFRSLQFTSLNTLAFADVEQSAMSRATSFNAVVQQLSLSGGVALAALLLELFSLGRHGELIADDFRWSFFVIGLLALGSTLAYLKLDPWAGAEVSGHGPAAERQAERQAERPAEGRRPPSV